MMTGSELAVAIETIIQQSRAAIGEIGRRNGYIIQADDGKYVLSMMTPHEMLLVNEKLFGNGLVQLRTELVRSEI